MGTTRVGNARSAWVVAAAVAGALAVAVYAGLSRTPDEPPTQSAIAVNPSVVAPSHTAVLPLVDIVALSSQTDAPSSYSAVLGADGIDDVAVPLDEVEPGHLTAAYSYRASDVAAARLKIVQIRSSEVQLFVVDVVGEWAVTLPPSAQASRTLLDFTAPPAIELTSMLPLVRAGYRVVARTGETMNTRTTLTIDARASRADVLHQMIRFVLRITVYAADGDVINGYGAQVDFYRLEAGHVQAVYELGDNVPRSLRFAILAVDESSANSPPTDLGAWTVDPRPAEVDTGRLELRAAGDMSRLSKAGLKMTVGETSEDGIVSVWFDLEPPPGVSAQPLQRHFRRDL